MAYLCEYDRCGNKRNDNELFVEWLEHDGRVACEVKYVPERTCKIEGTYDDEFGIYDHLTCGHVAMRQWPEPTKFCPHCGARVVE